MSVESDIKLGLGLTAEISGYGLIGAGAGAAVVTVAKAEEIQLTEEKAELLFVPYLGLVIIGAILASKFRVSHLQGPKH